MHLTLRLGQFYDAHMQHKLRDKNISQLETQMLGTVKNGKCLRNIFD
jgi:hypothetical protein